MPLMKYFVFVGGALVLLLLAMNWLVPDPKAEPVYSSIERPVIRISSIETLPERVVFDTSMPYIAPPPSVMDFAERWPVANTVEITGAIVENRRPKPTTVSAGVPKKQRLAKREPVKNVAAHRAAPPINNAATSKDREEAAAPVTRLSLLDILKDRFGQNLFKLD